MKDYKPGILVHRCSNAMRIGKPIKIHQKTTSVKRVCPNCKKKKATVMVAKEN